ncbi:MAG: argininosuccinate lyase [Gammaproteobacteria bacterium]|nr:argininosuccinate lyase [Gammaproteobacteria bacterium]
MKKGNDNTGKHAAKGAANSPAENPARNPAQNPGTTGELLRGRFAEPTDDFVQRFTASVSFDARLYTYDIRGSIAHATMLADVGVLTDDECARIVAGLETIHKDIEAGKFVWSTALEDVHMNIEARLIEIVGETGKKLHTGRSRNDQIATDIRLYLRDEIDSVTGLLAKVMANIVTLAEQHAATPMPGFTHLQTAQPITFGHHLLAWFEMAHRDRDRFTDCRKRVDVSPLGAAALAGTTFPIDREHTAATLGFDAVCENSLDAVSDRDFAIEFCAAASLTAVHLSRWCEEMVLWTSQPFAFIDLPDAYCTGSSIMPQKKNPDVPELIRGKTGRMIGHLVALLTLMKGQPLAYNKDNQEDKEPLFDAVDTLKDCLRAIADIVAAMQPNAANLRSAAEQGFATATDLADYLVRKGLPFRDAHGAVGAAVRYAADQSIALSEIPLDKLKSFNAMIEHDVYDALSLEGSLAARDHFGGTAPIQVAAAVARAKQRI